MKTLKIIAALTLVALAAALLIASAYAYTGGRIGTSATTNSPNTATSYGSTNGGMMGRDGMMGGYGYSGAVGTAPTAIEHTFDNYQQHPQTNLQLDDRVLQRHNEQNSIGRLKMYGCGCGSESDDDNEEVNHEDVMVPCKYTAERFFSSGTNLN